MARVYAIASAKGGVGKTTTTANLGSTLAGTGADVVVIDGDIGMANLGAALGVQPDGATLHDVLSDAAEPVDAAYDGPAGLTVVPGDTSLEAFAAADPQRLDAVVEAFADADYILIDVGAGVSHETGVPLSIADAVILVSTPERDALVDTEKTRQLTDRLGGVVAGAVITRTDEATPLEEVVSGTLSADVLTTIPDDEAVRESIAVGEPLVSYAPHSDAAAAYRQLAAELTGIDPTTPESTPADAAETQETLEARDDQLSESLSEGGVTIDAGDDDGDEGEGRPLEEYPSTDDTAGASKWAEAATGTVGDVDSAVEDADLDTGEAESTETDADPEPPQSDSTDPEPSGPADTDADEESVPPDAIPFSGGRSTAESSTPDEEDDEAVEDTAQTTVLGAAMADEDAPASSTVDANEDDDEAVVIPDAEETAGAVDDVDEPEEATDSDENEDEEEKRGFFSRLFR